MRWTEGREKEGGTVRKEGKVKRWTRRSGRDEEVRGKRRRR